MFEFAGCLRRQTPLGRSLRRKGRSGPDNPSLLFSPDVKKKEAGWLDAE